MEEQGKAIRLNAEVADWEPKEYGIEEPELEFYQELLATEDRLNLYEEEAWEIPGHIQAKFCNQSNRKILRKEIRLPVEKVQDMAKKLSNGEPKELFFLFESVLFYFICEYDNPKINDVSKFLMQQEENITEVFLELADLHPAKRSYLNFWEKLEKFTGNENLLRVTVFTRAEILIELASVKWESLVESDGKDISRPLQDMLE